MQDQEDKLQNLQEQNNINEQMLAEKIDNKPLDEHQLKIKQIEEKIRKRKEEHEAKKIKSKQMDDLFVNTKEQ